MFSTCGGYSLEAKRHSEYRILNIIIIIHHHRHIIERAGRNICHGSDSPEAAKHEIEYWFDESEVSTYTSHSNEWVYEKGAVVATGAPAAAKGEKKEKKVKAPKADAAAPVLSKKEAEKAKEVEKKNKACIKEGGKKGQDIAGMASFGCHFFLTSMIEADGSLDHLRLSMDAANVEVDPEGEDRKGGSGDLAKIFFTASDDTLAILAHFPVECDDKGTTLAEFMAACLKPAGATMTLETERTGSCIVKGDGATVFTLKLRDECIAAGFEYLRSKQLIMDDDDSGDDINFADDCGVDLNAGGGDAADY
jgi:hypothetical protein